MTNDSRYLKNLPKSGGSSKYIKKAYQQITEQITETDSSGLYGRMARVVINNSLILDATDGNYDIDFEVPFDDDAEVNTSTITLYNLSSTTLAQIQVDMPLVLTAGYEQDSSGEILNGKITAIKNYWDDLDYVTEITVIDYNGTNESDLEDISYDANISASQILQDLCNRLGIPIALFQTKRDYTFPDAVKVTGGLIESIIKYAKICGVHAWINKSNLYVCGLDVPISPDVFNLSADTGLLSVDTWTENEKNEDYDDTVDGVTVKMLLQHRVYTGCTLNISSKNVAGQFKVREGKHTGSTDDFVTEVKAVRMG